MPNTTGSFLEFFPILSIIRDRYTPSTLPYHLIAPSVPGWAFSSPPPLDKEFSIVDVVRIFDKLMSGIGFGSGYVVQGGDVGSLVARMLAFTYESCKGERTYTILHGKYMILLTGLLCSGALYDL